MIRIRNNLLEVEPNLKFRIHDATSPICMIIKHKFLYYVFVNGRLKIITHETFDNITDILK